MIFLALIYPVLALIGYPLIEHFGTDRATWLAFDLIPRLAIIVVSFGWFSAVNRKNCLAKLVLCGCFLVAIVDLFDYLLAHIQDGSEGFLYIGLARLSVWALCAIAFAMAIFRYGRIWAARYSHTYDSKRTYLCRHLPKSRLGCLGMLAFWPFGQTSLIIKGREFYFSGGQLMERAWIPSPQAFLQPCPPVSLVAARRLVGQEWSVKNNCHSVFERLAGVGGRKWLA